MFRVTQNAAEQIRFAAANQADAVDPPMLRVAAKYGDHGEILYGMGFDEQRESDEVVESAGVVILIAPPSRPLLEGTTLDFAELHPGEFQFVFINPLEAAGSCGSSSGGESSGGCSSDGCGGCSCG